MSFQLSISYLIREKELKKEMNPFRRLQKNVLKIFSFLIFAKSGINMQEKLQHILFLVQIFEGVRVFISARAEKDILN